MPELLPRAELIFNDWNTRASTNPIQMRGSCSSTRSWAYLIWTKPKIIIELWKSILFKWNVLQLVTVRWRRNVMICWWIMVIKSEAGIWCQANQQEEWSNRLRCLNSKWWCEHHHKWWPKTLCQWCSSKSWEVLHVLQWDSQGNRMFQTNSLMMMTIMALKAVLSAEWMIWEELKWAKLASRRWRRQVSTWRPTTTNRRMLAHRVGSISLTDLWRTISATWSHKRHQCHFWLITSCIWPTDIFHSPLPC